MKRLLIVEDDPTFAEALSLEFDEKGYATECVHTLKDLKSSTFTPDYAVIDLKLKGESGLDAVAFLKQRYPSANLLVLTGYGSIATAVQAVKLGAMNYISKPASVAAIEAAFQGRASETDENEKTSLSQHEREYIEKVVADHQGNISQAAKALGIHRQSLQRKLRKFT